MTMTQKGTRGQMLATRLEEATHVLIAQVEPCSEAQWRASAPNEDRSVGTMVHHTDSQRADDHRDGADRPYSGLPAQPPAQY
jgi:hypothetical protein